MPPRTRSLLASLLCLTAACGASGQRQSDEVAIGLATNLKRPGMLSIHRGVLLAVDQLNKEGARKGMRFAVRTVPNDVTSAVKIATTLRDDPTVVGVVGHTDSGSSLETTPIYADLEQGGKRALVAVSPTSTSPSLSGRSPWLFRVCPSDADASRAVARYVLDSLGVRRAAVLYRNDVYGKGWTRAFVEAFRSRGGEVVIRDPHLSGMSEWPAVAAYVAKVRPGVVLFPGSPQDAMPFVRALRAQQAWVPLIGGDAISEIGTDGGTEFNGIAFTAFFLPGRPLTPEGREFVERYQAAYRGALPDQRAALAYDAALLIGRAALAVGPKRQAVRDHIAEVGRKLPALKGATGAIAFDQAHDVIDKPIIIATVGQ